MFTQPSGRGGAFIHGLLLAIGFGALGFLLGQAALQVKALDRTVQVKGLSEREYPADIVIWPIQFTEANNDLQALYQSLQRGTVSITQFLAEHGIAADDISQSTPTITDKSAQQYGNSGQVPFRYTGQQTVTVYSEDIETVRRVMREISELGKQGLVISGNNYEAQTEYLFTRLNDIKPEMIEEATRNARAAAQKFAQDSDSILGKIRTASQGQFSIRPRDKNNPHIKTIRVVSTVEYYLSD